MEDWSRNNNSIDEEEFKRLAMINLERFKIVDKIERNKIINNLMGGIFNKRFEKSNKKDSGIKRAKSVLVKPFKMQLF